MLIHAKLPDGIGAAVIFNSVTIYHEDDDKGYSQSFDAEMVASRISEATLCPVTVIDLTIAEAGGDEWNFDTVREVAVEKYRAKLFIQIPVDLKAAKLCDGGLDWSTPWDAAEQAAKACKAQGLDAATGEGKAFGIYINGMAANGANKDHKKIVKAVLADVQRRIGFMK